MSEKLNVVGVSGQAGAGKDEVAGRLVSHHGFQQVALADPLKRLGYLVFGFTENQLWGPSTYRNKVSNEFKKGDGWKESLKRLKWYGPAWTADALRISPTSEKAKLAYTKLETWFEWLERNHHDLSPRVMLQTLGTEWGRDVVGTNVWVAYMLFVARKLLKTDEMSLDYEYNRKDGLTQVEESSNIRGVVVSDIRFKNELEIVPKAGGFLIRVLRPETDEVAQEVGIASHPSESDQLEFSNDLFDAILKNEGSLKDLYENVDVIASVFD